MMRVLLVLGRWCKRHKLVVAMLGLIAAIAFLPMFPYFPDCDQYPYAVYEVHLSDRYRVELTEYLKSFRVRYIVLGNVVLVTFWDWLNDPGSWILNASNKAVFTLIDRWRILPIALRRSQKPRGTRETASLSLIASWSTPSPSRGGRVKPHPAPLPARKGGRCRPALHATGRDASECGQAKRLRPHPRAVRASLSRWERDFVGAPPVPLSRGRGMGEGIQPQRPRPLVALDPWTSDEPKFDAVRRLC
jgi:hypothetical protein